MPFYVAHSRKPDAVRCVRELRTATRVTVVLVSVGILLLLVAAVLPETSVLRGWLVVFVALSMIGAFSVGLATNKLRDGAGRLQRTGEVRKVSCHVRRNYLRYTKNAGINPCDDELFDYDEQSQTSREALDAKFGARHGRNGDV